MIRKSILIIDLVMNKFGRSLPKTSQRQKGVRVLQAPNLIALTKDGDYNLKDHRLCNVKTPEDDFDAVNRKFVDSLTSSLLAKIDGSSSDCAKLVENEISNLTDNYKKYVDTQNNRLRDDIKSLMTLLTDANKNYIDTANKQLHIDIKTVNEELLKLTKSFNTISNVRDADYMNLEERFNAIDAKIQKVNHQTIENLKPEFDQLEEMLKATINPMIQTHIISFVKDLARIKKELNQLNEKVASLERFKYK